AEIQDAKGVAPHPYTELVELRVGRDVADKLYLRLTLPSPPEALQELDKSCLPARGECLELLARDRLLLVTTRLAVPANLTMDPVTQQTCPLGLSDWPSVPADSLMRVQNRSSRPIVSVQ